MIRLGQFRRRTVLGALVATSAALLATASGSLSSDIVGVPYGRGEVRPAQSVEFDQMFIDMMVPHHLGAVEMAYIAQSRAEHAEILSMADDIIRSQTSEIDQMRAWRQAWYGSGETPPLAAMPMLHDAGGQVMSMGTMSMAQEVDQLRSAPEPFDQAFIDAMIPHHQSAIEAARLAVQYASRQEIKVLAAGIIGDQEREINQMRQWRLAWYGAGVSPTVLPDTPMNMPGMGH